MRENLQNAFGKNYSSILTAGGLGLSGLGLLLGGLFALKILLLPAIALSIASVIFSLMRLIHHRLDKNFLPFETFSHKRASETDTSFVISPGTPSHTASPTPSFPTKFIALAAIFIALGITLALTPSLLTLAGVSAPAMSAVFTLGTNSISIDGLFILMGGLFAAVVSLLHVAHVSLYKRTPDRLEGDPNDRLNFYLDRWEKTGSERFIVAGAIVLGIAAILIGLAAASGKTLIGLPAASVAIGAILIASAVAIHGWHIFKPSKSIEGAEGYGIPYTGQPSKHVPSPLQFGPIYKKNHPGVRVPPYVELRAVNSTVSTVDPNGSINPVYSPSSTDTLLTSAVRVKFDPDHAPVGPYEFNPAIDPCRGHGTDL